MSQFEQCIYCKATNSFTTDYKAGQVACSSCGTVQDERLIDDTQEWRNFGSENTGNSSTDGNRCGAPTSPYLEGATLSTSISVKTKNSTLSKYSNRFFGNGNSTFMRGVKRLEELSSILDLHTNIIDRAKDNLKKIEESKKLKGRSLEAVIASILFATCRQCKAPRNLKDIIQILNLKKNDVMRCYASIKAVLNVDNQTTVTQNTLGLVRQYCNKLGLPPNIAEASREIAEKLCTIGLIEGRNPSTVATASILHATNLYRYEKTNKKEISIVSRISETTITHAYNIIMTNSNELTPSAFNKKK